MSASIVLNAMFLWILTAGFAAFGDEKTKTDNQLQPVKTSITVTEKLDNQVTQAASATKTDTPILDIPQSIQVISLKLIEDQQALTFNDAIRNVSGVTVPNSSGGRLEDMNIRGFTTSMQFKDGFRNDFQSNRAANEMQNIERIEVLKGPSSGVFGRLEPGGTVNVLTKRPQERHRAVIGYQTGTWRLRRPTLDLTGPLNKSKSLLYRFNFAYDQADSFRDTLRRDKVFAAPSLTWRLGDRNFFRVNGEYLGGSNILDRGLTALGNRPDYRLPVSRYLGDPAIPYNYEQGFAAVAWDRILSPRWTFKSAFRASAVQAAYDGRQPRALAANNRTLSLNTNFSNQWLTTQYFTNDLVGKFSTGTLDHTFLAGLDLNRETFDSLSRTGANVNIDILEPNYAALPAPGNPPVTASSLSRNLYGGAYLQDQVKVTNWLKFMAGIRYDIAQLRNDNRFANRRTNFRNTAPVPRVGVVVQPKPWVSIYANWSKSFNPQSGVSFVGEPFQPERGSQYEAGVKFDALRSRIIATAAVFRIEKTNVLTADPLQAGFSIQVGAQRNRGFEFDLTSQLTRQWTLVTGYAHNKPVITADNTYRPGNFLLSAPRNSGSLWTSYEFDGGFAKGLGIGGGIFAVGSRWGDLENSFIVPGYARVDGAVYYKWFQQDKLRSRLSLNFNNLTDRRYYEGVRGRLGIVPGAPRSLTAGLQVMF